jgi:cobalt/nickel transport system permease protein
VRHATFARFNTQASPVHRLDARTKLVLLLAFLISLALLERPSAVQLCFCFLSLLFATRAANLPIFEVLRMSLIVIPVVGLCSLIVYLSGDLHRAASILTKSYLSAFAVMVCMASTPLHKFARAARFLHVPGFLVEVTELIHRYLFVLGGEIQIMRIAFAARTGRPGRRAFQSAAGMIAVLFGRAFDKAGMVHNAMLSRGYSTVSGGTSDGRLQIADIMTLSLGLILVTVLHFI